MTAEEEAQARGAILEEAGTWLRTPWGHDQMAKGAGVDSCTFVASVYVATGLLTWTVLMPDGVRPYYPPDFAINRSEERLLEGLALFADPISHPQPGDIAAWKFWRCYSHPAIVIEWPRIIHAYLPERMVVYGDASRGALAAHPVRFFSKFARLQREGG